MSERRDPLEKRMDEVRIGQLMERGDEALSRLAAAEAKLAECAALAEELVLTAERWKPNRYLSGKTGIVTAYTDAASRLRTILEK